MDKKTTSIFVGRPKPISEALGQLYVSPEIVNAIKAIPPGHALQTTLPRSAARVLLQRLERHEDIQPGTYRARSSRQGGVKNVFIVHIAEPRQMRQAAPAGSTHAEATPVEIPSPQEIARYISEQQERRHSIGDVAQHFMGRQIDPRAENTSYHKVRNAMLQAQALLTQEQGGKFIEEKVGHRKIYRWTSK